MVRDLEHRAAFEQQGETYVRVFAQRDDHVGREAKAWLGEKQVEREEAAAAQRDAREKETLAIAKRSMKASQITAFIAAAGWAGPDSRKNSTPRPKYSANLRSWLNVKPASSSQKAVHRSAEIPTTSAIESIAMPCSAQHHSMRVRLMFWIRSMDGIL